MPLVASVLISRAARVIPPAALLFAAACTTGPIPRGEKAGTSPETASPLPAEHQLIGTVIRVDLENRFVVVRLSPFRSPIEPGSYLAFDESGQVLAMLSPAAVRRDSMQAFTIQSGEPRAGMRVLYSGNASGEDDSPIGPE